MRAQVLAPVWAQALTRLLGWLSVLGFVVAGVALFWVFRGTGPRAVRVARERPWRSALVGLGVLVVPPIVALPLFLTLVGLPVALLILLLWVLGLFLGPIPAVAAAGERLLGGRGGILGGFVVAALLWRGGMWLLSLAAAVLYLIPLVIGLGAFTIGAWEARRGSWRGRAPRPRRAAAGVISGPEPLGDDREPPGSDHLTRLAERRERTPPPPGGGRVLTVGAGGLGAAVGLVLLLPFPEFGVPLLVAGLGALALEFDWAPARSSGPCAGRSARRWFRSLRPATRWSLVGIGAAASAACRLDRRFALARSPPGRHWMAGLKGDARKADLFCPTRSPPPPAGGCATPPRSARRAGR